MRDFYKSLYLLGILLFLFFFFNSKRKYDSPRTYRKQRKAKQKRKTLFHWTKPRLNKLNRSTERIGLLVRMCKLFPKLVLARTQLN